MAKTSVLPSQERLTFAMRPCGLSISTSCVTVPSAFTVPRQSCEPISVIGMPSSESFRLSDQPLKLPHSVFTWSSHWSYALTSPCSPPNTWFFV